MEELLTRVLKIKDILNSVTVGYGHIKRCPIGIYDDTKLYTVQGVYEIKEIENINDYAIVNAEALFADDVITAQNRINGAYEFIYMVGYGIVLVIALYCTRLIKIHIFSEENERKLREIPSKIKSKFSKKN